MKNMKLIKKIIISIICIVLVFAVAGTSIALYKLDMNKYERTATPSGFSVFTQPQKKLINDADFYVSTKGSDDNDGSFSAPFKTIKKASGAVEKLVSSGTKKYEKITVAVMAGEYAESDILFDEKGSGSEGTPVTYTAYGDGEVIVNGGMTLKSEDFENVSGEAAERLNKDVVNNVKILDLSKYNLTVDDYGKLKSVGGFTTEKYYDGAAEVTACELFFNNSRMELAKYPNEGNLKEGEVLDKSDCYEPNPPGPTDETWLERRNQRGGTFVMDDETYNRVKSWKTTENVWVFGYFFWDWADMSTPIAKIDDSQKSLTTKYCSKYGFREGGIYHFYNVLEELDAPGEYYIDRENNILYFYPPEDLKESDVMLSVTDKNIFTFSEKAQYISINGITIQGTRGNAVGMLGQNCSLTNCNIKNAAGVGVEMKGMNNTIQSCEINAIGKDGIILESGDRETFTYGNNVVDNNSIHDYGEVQKSAVAAVTLVGIGNKISHNEIYNAPQTAIHFTGNENIIEYNNIHDVVLQSSDAGAIYTGFNYSTYGNVVRYNSIYNIGSGDFTPNAIYFDENTSGQTAYGNVLINIPGYAFLIGGGRDNKVTDNLIINAQKGIDYDDRAYDGYHNDGWYGKNVKETDGRLWVLMNEAKALNEKWNHKYEGIDRMHQDYSREDDEGFAVNPSNSTVTGNVIIKKAGKIGDVADSVYKYSNVSGNFTYKLKNAEGFFENMKNGDFSFAENSQLLKDNPNLKEISFEKVGRY